MPSNRGPKSPYTRISRTFLITCRICDRLEREVGKHIVARNMEYVCALPFVAQSRTLFDEGWLLLGI